MANFSVSADSLQLLLAKAEDIAAETEGGDIDPHLRKQGGR